MIDSNIYVKATQSKIYPFRLCVCYNEKTYRQLKVMSSITGMRMADIVRKAVKDYLDNNSALISQMDEDEDY